MRPFVLAAALLCIVHSPSNAEQPAIGSCVRAKVSAIMPRLQNLPDSGIIVVMTNGIASTSYERNAHAAKARVGDSVIACLISVPKGCPRGDDRGRVYTVVDLRTLGSWTMPNDEHSCGGA